MVVHIAASLYLTSLPNHLQETVGKKDYFKKNEYCTIYYHFIRCWCHLLRLRNLKLSSKFCCSLKRTSCGNGMYPYPQQTWKSLWSDNNFQQPIKMLFILRHLKLLCKQVYIETKQFLKKNLLFNLFKVMVVILPTPPIFSANVYLTYVVCRNTRYSLWWLMWVWR